MKIIITILMGIRHMSNVSISRYSEHGITYMISNSIDIAISLN